MKSGWVYFLKLSEWKYKIGITSNLDLRLEAYLSYFTQKEFKILFLKETFNKEKIEKDLIQYIKELEEEHRFKNEFIINPTEEQIKTIKEIIRNNKFEEPKFSVINIQNSKDIQKIKMKYWCFFDNDMEVFLLDKSLSLKDIKELNLRWEIDFLKDIEYYNTYKTSDWINRLLNYFNLEIKKLKDKKDKSLELGFCSFVKKTFDSLREDYFYLETLKLRKLKIPEKKITSILMYKHEFFYSIIFYNWESFKSVTHQFMNFWSYVYSNKQERITFFENFSKLFQKWNNQEEKQKAIFDVFDDMYQWFMEKFYVKNKQFKFYILGDKMASEFECSHLWLIRINNELKQKYNYEKFI